MAAINDEFDELNALAEGLPALIQAQEATAVAAGAVKVVAAAQAVAQTKVDALKATLTTLKISSTPQAPAGAIPAGDANDSIPGGVA